MEDTLVLKWSPLEEDTLATLSSTNGVSIYAKRESVVKNAYGAMRFTAFDYSPTNPGLLACGTESGQIVLFRDGVKRETFTVQGPRAIRFVIWDVAGDGKLAIGFAGARGEPAVHIVDSNGFEAAMNGSKHLADSHALCPNESAFEGNFLRPHVIAVGLQSRYLRVIDYRQPETAASTQVLAHTWGAVRGVRTHRGELIATFGAAGMTHALTNVTDSDLATSCIKIWDARRLDKPVSTVSMAKGQLSSNVKQIEWDPFREGMLRYIHGNESHICAIIVSESDDEHFFSSPARCTGPMVAAFALKPDSACAAIADASGALHSIQMREPVLGACDPDGTPLRLSTQPHSQMLVTMPHVEDSLAVKLVKAGYGADPSLNAKLAPMKQLSRLWEWIGRGAARSYVDPCSMPSRRLIAIFPSYVSAARHQAMRLCGWGGFNQPKPDVDWQTAAALCVLDLRDMRKGVSMLTSLKSTQDDYMALAIATALSGWPGSSTIMDDSAGNNAVVPVPPSGMSSPSPTTGVDATNRPPSRLALEDDDDIASRAQMWCDSVTELTKRTSPLLTAALELIIACTIPNRGKPEDVIAQFLMSTIDDPSISMCDRLGLACSYLPDDALKQVLDKLVSNAVQEGQLEGLVLTGLHSPASRSILQSAMDLAGELNHIHVALISAIASVDEAANNPWLELHRDWLDRAGLFVYRARLDVGLSHLRSKKPVASKETVHVHCAKCGTDMVATANLDRPPKLGFDGRRLPSRLCGNCARTLPTCSVCHGPIEWPVPGVPQPKGKGGPEGGGTRKQAEFRSWLSWCLECKHGGHVGCLSDWFGIKRICAVPGCNCTKCAASYSRPEIS